MDTRNMPDKVMVIKLLIGLEKKVEDPSVTSKKEPNRGEETKQR